MLLLDSHHNQPEKNLAIDEALLEQAEQAHEPREVLRLWEAPSPLVVVGRSSKVNLEVNLEICQKMQIPVLRRTSGGAAVVAGPGCLMYAVILSYELRPQLRSLDQAHRFVMDKKRDALASCAPDIRIQGICDLTYQNRKFSGNSVRCRRSHLLYHGTVLYDFPLELIASCLRSPPRQPDYRQEREHDTFVTNLPVAGEEIRRAIGDAWEITALCADPPEMLVERLIAEKYARGEWNFRY